MAGIIQINGFVILFPIYFGVVRKVCHENKFWVKMLATSEFILTSKLFLNWNNFPFKFDLFSIKKPLK